MAKFKLSLLTPYVVEENEASVVRYHEDVFADFNSQTHNETNNNIYTQ
jgi:hypothetical protein